jgi:protein O-GlcNAc transferase
MPTSRIQPTAKQRVMSLVQMNRLDDAKVLCIDLSKQHPGDAELWFILGALCERLGQYLEAEKYCAKATRLQPNNPGAHYNLGIVLNRLGKFDKAARSFNRAIALKPDFAEAYTDLGNSWSASGHASQATDAYKQAIRLKPDFVNAYIQLGINLHNSGQGDIALEYLQMALGLLTRTGIASGNDPVIAKVYFHIANTHFSSGRMADSISNYQQALRLNPNDFEAHNNFGNTLMAAGKLTDAIDEYRTATSINPMYALAYINLGSVLRETRQLGEALSTLEMAVHLDNDRAEGHHNLANVLQDLHRYCDAASSYRQALQLAPRSTESEVGLGNALLSQGKASEAIRHFRKAVRLDPEHADAHSCLLFALNYLHETSPESIFSEHVKWGKVHANAETHLRHTNETDPVRKLQIGYVSPDLRCHSVAFFLEPLLKKHNPDAVEVTCYSEVSNPDNVTERLKSLANHWQDTKGKRDGEVVDMIRKDNIDILVDLAGHSQGNRLPVFGHKPAPVQISWLGYPNTTGVAAIDYRITDAHADPQGMTDKKHTERLIRLPGCFLCYSPPDPCPDVGPLPAESRRYITFGSFNMLAKISQQVVAQWSSILKAVPASRLILKTRAFQDSETCDYYHDMFQQQGITQDRLELIPWTQNIYEHLCIYNSVDIALDPFPYNGTTTSCEALWMGVPVITLEGICHAARVGASLLHAVDLPELIASTPEAYREIAIALANNIGRLQEFRETLRNQVVTSRLCDSVEHASNIENAYRYVWKEWCARHN